MSNSRYIRPAQAANVIGIGLSTLWDWCKKKKPGFPKPYRLSARCTVFDAAELDAFVKASCQTTQS